MLSLDRVLETIILYLYNAPKGVTLTRGLATVFAGYLALVRFLRFKRYREIHRTYQRKYEERTLTPEEAQKIILVSSGYDMPMLLNYSLAFALFKTYGIVSQLSFALYVTHRPAHPSNYMIVIAINFEAVGRDETVEE